MNSNPPSIKETIVNNSIVVFIDARITTDLAHCVGSLFTWTIPNWNRKATINNRLDFENLSAVSSEEHPT